MLNEIAKQDFMSKPQRCSYCQRIKRTKEDLESIFETGMCLGCDHAYGEELEEKQRDLAEIGL